MTPNGSPSGIVTRLSIMMFLQFFVWGAWYVSQTGFMNVQGMSPLIAWAYTVGPIAAIVSPFFLGMIADRFFASQRVLGTLHLLGGAAMLLVPVLARPYVEGNVKLLEPYILLLLVHMLCYMPTLGLTTSLSLANLSDAERQFPMVRVWGTIGWIVGNIVVSGNLKTWGLDVVWIADGDKSPLQFYITGGAALALGVYSFMLPNTPPPLKGKAVSAAQILGLDALSLLKKPAYLVFIICSFLLCIPLAGYYGFGRNFVEASGFANATMTMSFGQMSEIFFMLVMPLCFRKLGFKWMLAVGMLAWIVRYGLFGTAWQPGESPIQWMVLGGILLHGICYDFFFVTGMVYVEREAPAAIRSQAQGFLVLVTQGLGMLLGAQAFGAIVTKFTAESAAGDVAAIDWRNVWYLPAGFAAAILVLFVLLFRAPRPAAADKVD